MAKTEALKARTQDLYTRFVYRMVFINKARIPRQAETERRKWERGVPGLPMND